MTDRKVLNPEQKRAVEHKQGPLLIIAGAGTGKTTVITERIRWLINQGLAKPAEILALTFTEKAAQEMEERVDQAMPYGYTQMWIATFHSFCDRVLRDEAVNVGLDPGFVLMTEAESLLFLKNHLFDLPLNYFRPQGNPTKFLGGLLQHFNRLRDEDISPNEYFHWAQTQKSHFAEIPQGGQVKSQNDKSKIKIDKTEVRKYLELARAFKKYQELKIKESRMDFSDLISNTLQLFRKRKYILREYQQRFRYLLVDEFQDTNISQNELAILLARPPHRRANITVACDDDQAIYKWRGAAIANVLQFRKRFPKAKVVSLIRNYRSTKTILDAAYQLIQHNNPDRLEIQEKINKRLMPVRKIKGEKIEFLHLDRVENEAEAVAKKIKNLKLKSPQGGISAKCKNYRWSDFAILVRANNHAHPFSQALTRHDIPSQFLGPGRLLRQPEIKNLIAYLQVLDDFEDDVAFFRVLTMDIFQVSARDLAAIRSFSRKHQLSLFTGCEEVSQEESQRPRPRISLDSQQKISKIIKMIHRHLKLIPKKSSGQILYYFLEETGLLKAITSYQTALAERQALNTAKFFDQLRTYESNHEDASVFPVVDWLKMKINLGESPLAADVDWSETDAVNLLTIHSAKGLEFPVVFLVNLVNQRFPTTQRPEQIPLPEAIIKEFLPQGDYHQQEERRLFYVGLTRAQDRLFLTAADYYAEAKQKKKISPFVSETLGEMPGRQAKQPADQLSFLDFKPAPSVRPARLAGGPAGEPLITISSLSYSQINTFAVCPLQYKYQYLLRIPTPASASLSFGETIHKTLRDFYRLKQPAGQQLLSLLEKNWSPLGYSSKAHEKKMLLRGKTILRHFYKKLYDSSIKPLALEQGFSFPLSRSLKIRGKIDRIDSASSAGKMEIIDYKTGKAKTQKEVDQDLQATIYALAATDSGIYGKKPEEIILSFIFLEPVQKLSTQRTAIQLTSAKKEIIQKAEAIQKSQFLPTPSKLCDFCPYQLLCDAWQ